MFPNCYCPLLQESFEVVVYLKLCLIKCKRGNEACSKQADVLGTVTHLSSAFYYVTLLSVQHQWKRSTLEVTSPWIPCFLGNLQWKLFHMKLACCQALDCSPSWNKAEWQKGWGSGKGVNGNIHFMCSNAIRNDRYTSNLLKMRK